jgi:cell division cycle 2-like protein
MNNPNNNKRFDRNDSFERGSRNFDDRRDFNPRNQDHQRRDSNPDGRDFRGNGRDNGRDFRDNRDNGRDNREVIYKEEQFVRERQYSRDEQHSREEIRRTYSIEINTKKSKREDSLEAEDDSNSKKTRVINNIQSSDDERYSPEVKLSQHVKEISIEENKSNVGTKSVPTLNPSQESKKTPEKMIDDELEEGAYIEEENHQSPSAHKEEMNVEDDDMGINRKSRLNEDDNHIDDDNGEVFLNTKRWEEDDDHSDDNNDHVVLNTSSSVKRSNQPIFFDSDENAEQEILKKEQELKMKDEEKDIPKPEVRKPKPVTPFVPINVNGCLACRSVTNFERVASIGQGAFGVVYKAKEKVTGDMVALKKVKMQKEKEGFPLTSVREIRILMQCKHVNIVTMKEVVVGSSVDSIFIVMEYVEHDLKGLLEDMNKNFTVSEVKCLLNQLLMGMEYLHDNWILHRDIKTSNLLLNNHGILKIADFGLARPYGSPIRPYTHVVVTLWYRAPELLLGTPTYTPAIDVWAVGCVFAEMLTRDPIFKGKNEADEVDKIFKVLGSPDNRNWPGFSVLPHAKNFNFTKKSPNNLRKQFSEDRLSAQGLDLLNRLLGYCPEKRITCSEALEHGYWEEAPLQKDPDLMPTWPSRTDGRKRKEPSPEQVEEKMEIERKGFLPYNLPASTSSAAFNFVK